MTPSPLDKCSISRTSFPECLGNNDISVSYTGKKDYRVAYARFEACNVDKEDMTTYGLTNDNAEWKKYAVELYRNAAGEKLYKHVGVSESMGEPYCLGDKIFGPNMEKLNIPFVGADSYLTPSQAQRMLGGSFAGNDISQATGVPDNFVLLFACERTSPNSAHSMKSYSNTLIRASSHSNFGTIKKILATSLGYPTTLNQQTTSKRDFTVPHYCQANGRCGLEPFADTAGCFEVDTCFYDGSACGANAFCQSDGSSCECQNGYLRYVPRFSL